ncbi:Nodule Cysteine-Rich (NCR) secreted peptide [Medicago truncatula]|nr:Nodule Cysteine-Rich (NCR) secreted peptide [Medicago truncatula]KEH29252.1 Nodule Cysteine-Rich (NCR) secreted peptide [Medicago truncatula]
MAQIIFYVYALIILFSPFLAARLVFVNPEKPCVTDADCDRYRHESAIYSDMFCKDGYCFIDYHHDPYP